MKRRAVKERKMKQGNMNEIEFTISIFVFPLKSKHFDFEYVPHKK